MEAERLWNSCSQQLPADGQRVLCWLPSNTVRLPGGGDSEERNVVLMRFAEDWFIKNPSKTGRKTHRHFWLGEGGSNCFFEQVTHWMALPDGPHL
ncbi:MAG: DUF551 domain-containing protein [Flavobacteriales bacterium]|jgi:hypothetical protein|nr:DUF551 domain-containing protein [Flavobacteriales bacterium]MBP9161362.1 DUF551 domain-containing protein [Flavobacteriales bacterium]MCI1753527.1 DUF551 domain-containing protein [Flavobacteriales bacterium]